MTFSIGVAAHREPPSRSAGRPSPPLDYAKVALSEARSRSRALYPIEAESRHSRSAGRRRCPTDRPHRPSPTPRRMAAPGRAAADPALPLRAGTGLRQATAPAAPHRPRHRARPPGGPRSGGARRRPTTAGPSPPASARRPTGTGTCAQQPKTLIQVGNRPHAVTAHFLTPDEGAEIMARYARRHPRTARRLCAFMGLPSTAARPRTARRAEPSPSCGSTPPREPSAGCARA